MIRVRTRFPDRRYIRTLVGILRKKVEDQSSDLELLRMYSSASMNWVADYILDPSVRWEKRWLNVDDLWLTAVGPKWNRFLIDQAKRSPKRLRTILETDARARKIFAAARFSPAPILVRHEDGQYKVLDGMNRVIAAIRSGRPRLETFVASPGRRPKASLEPHVVYDFIRALHRNPRLNRRDFLAAMRFLRAGYRNVDELLKERFSKDWIPIPRLQKVIRTATKK